MFQVVLLGLFNGQGLGSDYHLLIRETPPTLNAEAATTTRTNATTTTEYDDASNISQSNGLIESKPLHTDDIAHAPASTATNDIAHAPASTATNDDTETTDDSNSAAGAPDMQEGNQSVGNQGHFVKLVIHNNRYGRKLNPSIYLDFLFILFW
jgi:hypothetical protein